MYKKILSTFLLFLLMLPTSIEIFHDLKNHKHTICKSIGKQHLHKQNISCDEFHKQLTIFSINFTANFDVIPTHFYTTTFIDKPQIIKEIYHDNKKSRGPPSFTI